MSRMRRFVSLSCLLFVPFISAQSTEESFFGSGDTTSDKFGGGADFSEFVTVPTEKGPQRFFIESPQDDLSIAWRDNSDLADKIGAIPPSTPSHAVTNRIIVQTADPQLIEIIELANANVTRMPFDAAPDFYVLALPSVAEALSFVDTLQELPGISEAYLDIDNPKVLRVAPPTDPNYPTQWHLNNTSITIADVNAVPAWAAGWTGSGVTVGILEGGWQTTHPDLAANYNSTASQTGGSATSHGTSCAGVTAAVANNGRGGAGVAFGARLSQLLYGSSSTTATAFGFRNDLNAVKSNSWGPADGGRIAYMSSTERAALQNGCATGRGGRGTVYLFAAGNGGSADRPDYDPYASSRNVCAIGAIGDNDTRAYYNERGSAMMVVAHSNGNSRGIYTTTSGSTYTSSFGGTSSACPLAAGVVALMLQANPNLGWRDVQHVLIRSARRNHTSESSWIQNGAGRWVNYNYGFGAIDANAATSLARTWVNVGPEQLIQSGSVSVGATIPDNNTTGVTRTFTTSSNITVETVELILNVNMTYVGDLRITLRSPRGTESILAEARADPTDNYVSYTFLTRRCWDESSAGTWTINISDRAAGDVATWTNYALRIWGR